MSNATIDLSKIQSLECKSILESRHRSTSKHFIGGHKIESLQIGPMFYFPAGGLQISEGIIPIEGIFYPSHSEIAFSRIEREHGRHISLSSIRLAQPVCVLGNTCSRTFGHWMEEMLRVWICERIGFQGLYLVNHLIPSPFIQALELLKVDQRRVITVSAPSIIDEAFFTTQVNHFCAHHFANIMKLFRDHLAAEPSVSAYRSSSKRIWIDRSASSSGVNRKTAITNRQEIEELLQHFSFQCIDMGALPIPHQFAIATQARVLAGLHGSAHVHSALMRDASKVIEVFSPDYINPSVVQICLALSHRYLQVIPPPYIAAKESNGKKQEVFVDIDQLYLAISTLFPKESRLRPWNGLLLADYKWSHL